VKWQIIGDLHIDRKEEEVQEKINILDSYLDNDCKTVILCGDIFDKRNKISSNGAILLQELFEKYSQNKHFYIIVGNHDCKFHNTLIPNSVEASFGYMENVTVVNKPMDNIEGSNILLIPWICNENYHDCIDAIKTSKSDYCVGHFAINSFLMSQGIECKANLKISNFKNFKKVFSGHFHLRQEKKNIIYIGSIRQDTWTDFENQKGYYVVDNKIKFVEGSEQIYKHLMLENNKSDFDLEDYNDCHVKMFHYEKLTKKQFDKWNELLYNLRSYKVF